MLSPMRSNEIFAAMTGKEVEAFLAELKQDAPDVARLAIGVTAQAFRLRPEFLKKLPRAKQAEWMRRALGRTVGAGLAEEVLATYFLDHETDLLKELLDALGVPHEDGRLSRAEPPSPDAKTLESAVAKFRKGDRGDKRELLLRAFAAQSSIDWPGLDELLQAGSISQETAAAIGAAGAPAPAPVAPKPRAEEKPKAAPRAKAAPKTKAKAKAKPKAKARAKPAAKKKAGGKAKKKARKR